MRKVVIFIVATMALLLLSIPITGCEREVSFTTASLTEATMCQSVDDSMQPLNATDVFAPDTSEIFCSVKLSNAPPDTEVKAEWIYIEGELEDISNYLIDEWSLTANGTQYLSHSITIPDAGWPKGDYKIVLYVNGEEELSVPFAVK